MNMKINDVVPHAITVGYASGMEAHTEMMKITRFVPMGKKQILWAVGEVISSTDPRSKRIGTEDVIGVAE